MNPLEILKNTYEQLTKKECQIADMILHNPKIVMQTTSDSLAESADSSKTALIRMCQKMGYSGYTDLKYAIIRYLNSSQNENVNHSLIDSITDKYCKQISSMSEFITSKELVDLARKILLAKRIKSFGINRTGLASNQFKMRLSKIGIDCENIQDYVLFNDVLNYGTSDDLLILFSIKGNNQIYQSALSDYSKEDGIQIVLITMTPKCPLSKYAHSIITLPNISRTDSQLYFDDQAIYCVFIEILVSILSNTMQKTSASIASNEKGNPA